jgi:hypothetical protein
MKPDRNTSGLILIELVVTLILVGIIGTFVGLFLFTGMRGYMTSKETSEGALLAQTALERISKELRDIETMPSAPEEHSSITFTSRSLPGQRRISHADGVISISVDGKDWPLLTDVKTFNLSWTPTADLNHDNVADIAGITIAFNTEQIEQMFSTTIYPRGFFTAP